MNNKFPLFINEIGMFKYLLNNYYRNGFAKEYLKKEESQIQATLW